MLFITVKRIIIEVRHNDDTNKLLGGDKKTMTNLNMYEPFAHSKKTDELIE